MRANRIPTEGRITLLPPVGSLVYVNGNEAAIVIHVKDDNSLIVGHFSGASEVEAGDYGLVPSLKAENKPSFVPEIVGTPAPVAGEPVIPVAGAPVATTEEAPAPQTLPAPALV